MLTHQHKCLGIAALAFIHQPTPYTPPPLGRGIIDLADETKTAQIFVSLEVHEMYAWEVLIDWVRVSSMAKVGEVAGYMIDWVYPSRLLNLAIFGPEMNSVLFHVLELI